MSPALSPAAGQARRATPPLVWFGALRDPSGYADEARAFLLALDRAGYEVSARDVRWCAMDAGMTPSQLGALERAVARRPLLDDHILVHHMVPNNGQRLRVAGPNVWRTMFETDRILMTAVDTGWITDERPHHEKLRIAAEGWHAPLDLVDGAARVYDPIVLGEFGTDLFGCFVKDYQPSPW